MVDYAFLRRAQMLSIDLQTLSRQVTRKLEDSDIEGYHGLKNTMLKVFEDIEKNIAKGIAVHDVRQNSLNTIHSADERTG